MINQQLGRYHLVSELGVGAMGVVYRAMDPLIDRVVALKVINLSLSKDEKNEFERRFYSEAQSAGRLSHPNIVTVYDIGSTETLAYITMEYLEGDSLRTILDSGIVLPFDKIIDIVAQVAEGLACAHDSQVVHRDIKPANVMVLHNGVVKITDFGVALIPTGSRTAAGMTMGSPAYMAPEQVLSGKVDGRSDIYSLGVILYEMLSGRVPFTGENVSAVMYRVLHEPAPPPSTVNGNIPPVLDAIVLKMLAKDPNERYQSAREFAADLPPLREYLSSRTAIKPTSSPPVESIGMRGDTTVTLGLPDVPITANAGAAKEERGEILGLPEIPLEVDEVSKEARGGRLNLNRKKLVYAIATAAAVAIAFSLFHDWSSVPQDAAMVKKNSNNEQAQPAAVAVAVPKEGLPRETAPTIAAERPAPAPSHKMGETPKQSELTTKTVGKAVEGQSAESAYLIFSISPWGEIYVDGKKRGVSPPLGKLKVTPGKHIVEVRNRSMPVYQQKVDLESKSSIKIKHKFK